MAIFLDNNLITLGNSTPVVNVEITLKLITSNFDNLIYNKTVVFF